MTLGVGAFDILAGLLVAAVNERPNPGSWTQVIELKKPEAPDRSEASGRAGDRGRTGDVQLGKLAFYR